MSSGIPKSSRAPSQEQSEDGILQAIAEGTASKVGTDFFSSLVRSLAATLGVRFAVVTEALDQPPTRIRTLALWKGDGFSDPVEFDLAGTPCKEVFAGNVLFHPRHLARGFPAFGPRTCIDAESYFGLPLCDSLDRVIGHLACPGCSGDG